jgi:hypothetical protein
VGFQIGNTKMKKDNDNEPLAVGDRVRRRDMPWVVGTVWSVTEPIQKGWIMVDWDYKDETADVPIGRLERIKGSKP